MTLLEKKHQDIVSDFSYYKQKGLKTSTICQMLSPRYYLSEDRIQKIVLKLPPKTT